MPRYPYLDDDTPFTANSLNTRFDVLAGALNVLRVDAFAEKALNTVHVPSVVANIITSETPAARVETPTHSGAPFVIDAGGYTLASPRVPEDEGVTVTLTEALTLSRTTDATQPTALMVLANAEVKQFRDIEVIYGYNENPLVSGITLNEYTWDATLVLVFESSVGARATLYRTERQVSPRVTISTGGNTGTPAVAGVKPGTLKLFGRIPMSPLRDIPGDGPDGPVYQQFDHKTYQDVAIRTVVTAADIALMGIADIAKVHIGFLSGNNKSYTVQRANITAVPLLVEVV